MLYKSKRWELFSWTNIIIFIKHAAFWKRFKKWHVFLFKTIPLIRFIYECNIFIIMLQYSGKLIIIKINNPMTAKNLLHDRFDISWIYKDYWYYSLDPLLREDEPWVRVSKTLNVVWTLSVLLTLLFF